MMRVKRGEREQYIYDDKNLCAVITPLADGRWRAVKGGKTIGVYDSRSEAIAAACDDGRVRR